MSTVKRECKTVAAACARGKHVRFDTVTALVTQLLEANGENYRLMCAKRRDREEYYENKEKPGSS
jgi:hypothetical protein